MSKTQLDYKEVLRDWEPLLSKGLLSSEYMDKLIEFMDTQYRLHEVYPPKKDVFRAFRATPLKDVRVVILGQDPYPDGRATGLAFGNEEEDIIMRRGMSPSLQKIADCIERTQYDGLNLGFDPTLEHWAGQGVLLLNSALTIRSGSIGSHSMYWNRFIRNVLTYLSRYNPGCTYLLLGGVARTFTDCIAPKANTIFKYHHPAFSARQGIDWNCPYFTEINKLIELQNGKEFCIKW